jgi:hypothetical protein
VRRAGRLDQAGSAGPLPDRAAEDAGFAAFIHTAGAALAAPFRGILGTSSAGNGHPLEWADLVAIAIYTLAAWVVAKVVMISKVREDGSVPAAN